MRALPPGANLKPYAVYQVSKPLGVEAGVVRPWFGQPGLGFQYKLPASVQDLIDQGYLTRITE